MQEYSAWFMRMRMRLMIWRWGLFGHEGNLLRPLEAESPGWWATFPAASMILSLLLRLCFVVVCLCTWCFVSSGFPHHVFYNDIVGFHAPTAHLSMHAPILLPNNCCLCMELRISSSWRGNHYIKNKHWFRIKQTWSLIKLFTHQTDVEK